MPWIKAWHVIFMVTWFAGLFYLPRLFVYHASTTDSAGIERFRVMERRLFVLMTIGAALTALFGLWLLARNPSLLETGWMRVKLALVAAPHRLPRLELAAAAGFRRGPQRPQPALVPLVQRSAVAAPDRHRVARRRPAFLTQVPVSGADALRRSCHHGG